MKNIAYIDGQNVYMATTLRDDPWRIDLKRFRIYLEKKYRVDCAYYYLGYVQDGEAYQALYEEIQRAGFILVFREHSSVMLGKKKGNVDSDIIFSIMKRLYKKEEFENVVLVSGDGDYKMLVDFLIEEKWFEKVLFPDGSKASSLLKKLGHQYFDNLSSEHVRSKIQKKRGP